MMAEPVKLYSDAGETLVCAAPSEVRRLLETGEWADRESPILEPVPEPEKSAPKPVRRSKAE